MPSRILVQLMVSPIQDLDYEQFILQSKMVLHCPKVQYGILEFNVPVDTV